MRDTFPILVHIVLWRRGRILLLRRTRTGRMDGWYALPGGHLTRGESLLECARRECLEETGVRVAPAMVRPLAVLGYRNGADQGINVLFECRRFEGEARIAEPALCDDLCWAAPGALPEPTVPYLGPALALAERGEWLREFET
jgi:8-oxo-dGTP pyrophosphatase MutT (NUDIX family)